MGFYSRQYRKILATPQIPMPPSNNIQSSFNASVLHALWSTLMSVATSLRLQPKTKKSGTRQRKRQEIVYVLSERLEQATFMPTSFPGFSPIRPTEQGEKPGNKVGFMPAARLGKQCLLQQTLPCLNLHIFGHTISHHYANLCSLCFRLRYFS